MAITIPPFVTGFTLRAFKLVKGIRRRVSAPCPPHAKRSKFLSRRHSIWVSLVEIGGWMIYRTVDCSLPFRDSRFPTGVLRSIRSRSISPLHPNTVAYSITLFSLLKQDILSRLPFRLRLPRHPFSHVQDRGKTTILLLC